MKIVDSRSGTVLSVGESVEYGDGESVTLLAVEPGLLSARAEVRLVHADHMGHPPIENTMWVPLQVRWTHPKFFLQHVGFLPS